MEYLKIKEQILNRIKEAKEIIILRHIRPDGDCLGAAIGLREIIKASFPEKIVTALEGETIAKYLNFIGREDIITKDNEIRDALIRSLVIVVDTATFERIDNKQITKEINMIKIDHHAVVDDYGSINYVRDDLPASCLIIADFWETFKDELTLTSEASLALFTGIVTDTGRFRYKGVNSNVLRLASLLLEQNLDLENIYSNLYLRDVESLKMSAYVLSKFKSTENKVAYFVMTKRIQKKFNISVEAASSLVSVLEGIKEHLIWLLFIELPDGTMRVRMRSRYVAVNEIAALFQGGGHKQASGATVRNKTEAKELLFLCDEKIKKYKEEHKEII